MFNLSEYYKIIEKDRNDHFKLFKLASKDVFHKSFTKDTWSAELIFRHNLAVLNWFKTLVPNIDFEDSLLATKYGEKTEDSFTLEEIEKEFLRISPIIAEGIEKMTPEEEDEILKTPFGDNPRYRSISGLLNHESNHLGQVIWIFKRITDWTDQDIREKLYGVPKKSE
ncbi:MAG: hypothetical protein KAS95_04485 [Candidatus Heimdallarchaeota archaeon]|nr:hypothetical protein [Candidatus Heimdallarchaeota archaeon]